MCHDQHFFFQDIEAAIISRDTVTIAPARVRTVDHGYPVLVHQISRLTNISNSAIIIIIIIRRNLGEIITRTRSRDIRVKGYVYFSFLFASRYITGSRKAKFNLVLHIFILYFLIICNFKINKSEEIQK